MQSVTIRPWEIEHRSPVNDFSETIFFTGNGMLGVRGFGAWAGKRLPQDHAIFRAGLFSEIKPGITDMVQLPDVLTLIPLGEEPQTVVQTLDIQTGVLTHCWNTDRAVLRMRRTASMADDQLILQTLSITAEQAGTFTVMAMADTNVKNLPVHDDQTIVSTEQVRLLQTVSLTDKSMHLHTIQEKTPVAISWDILDDRNAVRETMIEQSAVLTKLTVHLAKGETWTIEKRVRVLLGRQEANPETPDPWRASAEQWLALWNDCDIEIESDDKQLQGALRYNMYQLLCNNAADDPTVSIGARGLSHGRYKGNVFWDTEIFLLPFFLWTRPQAAQNLLLYRVNHLDDACKLAAQQNLEGARFPWMCSGNGLEQCETWDTGLCEVHITADVVYAMQQYVEITGDAGLLQSSFAEVYRQTALYWMSRFTWEENAKQFSCFFVKGPDEYCGATVNNTYTNYMARNNINLALQYGVLSKKEREQAKFTAENIALLYDAHRDLYLQDELLDRLETPAFQIKGNEPSYKQYCFDRMQRYRLLKQADLVLLMNLYPADFTRAQKLNVFHYYEPITLHDSTLSYGAHAQLALTLGLWEPAEEYLQKAIYLDLKDIMGNTGREGLHMAALGSAWQAIVFGAAGLCVEENQLAVHPMLPKSIQAIKFKAKFRGEQYKVSIRSDGNPAIIKLQTKRGAIACTCHTRKKNAFTIALFLLPSLIGLVVFCFLPMLASIVYSLLDYDLLKPIESVSFVGLRNFKYVLGGA